VGDNRIIFDLGGNKYRLAVHVSFTFGRVLAKLSAPAPSTTVLIRRPDHGEKMIRPLRSEADYGAALEEIRRLSLAPSAAMAAFAIDRGI
jgi:hypothetical protein